MKLIGNLKNQVEKANNMEEAKGMIEKAGMELTAEELEMVTGGGGVALSPQKYRSGEGGPTAHQGDY